MQSIFRKAISDYSHAHGRLLTEERLMSTKTTMTWTSVRFALFAIVLTLAAGSLDRNSERRV